MAKVFGKLPSGQRLERIRRSENYCDSKFQNIEHTVVMMEGIPFRKVFREAMSRPKCTEPLHPLPHLKTDLKTLTLAAKPSVVWFGHSSYLIHSKGFTILVDPVFSNNASPVRGFNKAFNGSSVYATSDFPEIDLLILTHDHYDHLDYKTILNVKSKVKQVVCSLGVGAHLEYWGVAADKITELNWWEKHQLNSEIELTATPARHFSGRLIKRAQTLWSSFVLQLHGNKIFIGGDSGYDAQFKKIGDTFGPFDLAFLECGQYGRYWPDIHMLPEETVQAAKDLKAACVIPVHWGKFALSNHLWNEPIKRFAAEAKKKDQKFVAPMIGQLYVLGEAFAQEQWWEMSDKS